MEFIGRFFFLWKFQISDVTVIPAVTATLFYADGRTDGQTDTCDEDSIPSLRLYEHAYKEHSQRYSYSFAFQNHYAFQRSEKYLAN